MCLDDYGLAKSYTVMSWTVQKYHHNCYMLAWVLGDAKHDLSQDKNNTTVEVTGWNLKEIQKQPQMKCMTK